MVTTLEQVREGEAPAELAGVYMDIRRCLRTAYVPLPFRVIAAHRGALRAVWEQLRPNVVTRAFEECAGDLRASLARASVDLGTQLIEPVLASEGIDLEDLDEAREHLDVFHYTDPKVLLCLAALHAMESGETIGGRILPQELLAHVPAPDPTMPALIFPATEPGGVVGEILDTVTRGIGLPVTEIEIKALGHWPELLEIAWEQIAPMFHHRAFNAAMTALRQEALGYVRFFPFEMDPTRGLLAGTSEAVAAVSRAATLAEPALRLALFVSALKVSLDGPEDALDSMYAVEWDEPGIDQIELS